MNLTRNLITHFWHDSALHAALIGVIAWMSSIFMWAPSLTFYISQGSTGARRADLALQCFDVFRRDLSEPILYYRILQLFLAETLGLCSADLGSLKALLASPGLSFIASIMTLSFVYSLMRNYVNGGLAVNVVLLVGSTQVVQWSNNVWGAPDSFSLACIAALMLVRSRILIPLFIFIGSIADERTLISLPLLLVFRVFQKDKFIEPPLSDDHVNCLPADFAAVVACNTRVLLKELWPYVLGGLPWF